MIVFRHSDIMVFLKYECCIYRIDVNSCSIYRYLQEEWNARKRNTDGERDFNKDSMKGSCVKCPQQLNFSDCGIYVLQYAESFFTVCIGLSSI